MLYVQQKSFLKFLTLRSSFILLQMLEGHRRDQMASCKFMVLHLLKTASLTYS